MEDRDYFSKVLFMQTHLSASSPPPSIKSYSPLPGPGVVESPSQREIYVILLGSEGESGGLFLYLLIFNCL